MPVFWKDNPGRSSGQSARQARLDDRHAQRAAAHRAAEDERERQEERDRKASAGSYKHPAHEHPGGHIDPRKMTRAQARAHGLVVTRGLFGSSVQSRRSVIAAAHDAADEAHGYGRAIRDLKRQLGKKGADKAAITKAISKATAKKTAASRRAHKLGKMLLWAPGETILTIIRRKGESLSTAKSTFSIAVLSKAVISLTS